MIGFVRGFCPGQPFEIAWGRGVGQKRPLLAETSIADKEDVAESVSWPVDQLPVSFSHPKN
jgi:hypothetical protein